MLRHSWTSGNGKSRKNKSLSREVMSQHNRGVEREEDLDKTVSLLQTQISFFLKEKKRRNGSVGLRLGPHSHKPNLGFLLAI